jgi:hypothetical protein
MSGITEFFELAGERKELGAVLISLLLVVLFFGIGTGLVYTFDGGFIVTLTIILYLAGIVSLILFFIAIFELFEKI